MLAADVLVLGGPATGKTHFAGQLFGRLRHDRGGALRMQPGGATDLSKFEEVLCCLEEGRAAGHTPAKTWVGMKCRMETRDGRDIVLEWPDYAGERLASIVETRTLPPEWRRSIAAANAWMLFIRPSTLHLYEDILTRPLGPTPFQTKADTHEIGGMVWDDRAQLVEMLQMLLFATSKSTHGRVSRPRLAVVLSCWDELQANGTPEEVFRSRLQLLHGFVQSTWKEESWSVWGLSSLGRSLQEDSPDQEFVDQGPEKFGYVIPPKSTEQNQDLTLPVAWLLKE